MFFKVTPEAVMVTMSPGVLGPMQAALLGVVDAPCTVRFALLIVMCSL